MSNDVNDMNPYEAAPPTLPDHGPVNKPTSMVVFGIINLVYGVLGLIGLLFAAMTLLFDLPEDPNNPITQAMEDPTYQVISNVSQVVGLVMNVLLIAAGVGLINGKLYGRRLSIIYGVIGTLMVIAGAVINILYIALPTLDRAGEMPDGPDKIGAIVASVFFFVLPVCGLVYPVLLLIFMMRAPIKRYFRIA